MTNFRFIKHIPILLSILLLTMLPLLAVEPAPSPNERLHEIVQQLERAPQVGFDQSDPIRAELLKPGLEIINNYQPLD